MGDAMVEVAGRCLGAVDSTNRRDAYRTYVHLDTEGGWLTGTRRRRDVAGSDRKNQPSARSTAGSPH